VSGDETAVPADDRRGLHDEEHLAKAQAAEHPGQHREDCPVGLGELCSFDLALKNEQLVAQREDLGIALIARGEQPSEPARRRVS